MPQTPGLQALPEFGRWIPGLYTSCIFTLMTFAPWIMSELSVEKSDEILCHYVISDLRVFLETGLSIENFCTGAIFATDWGDFASCFSLLPMVQGTQVATGTIGLPFAQSESLQAWQRLTDGDLATVRTSKIFWTSKLDTMVLMTGDMGRVPDDYSLSIDSSTTSIVLAIF